MYNVSLILTHTRARAHTLTHTHVYVLSSFLVVKEDGGNLIIFTVISHLQRLKIKSTYLPSKQWLAKASIRGCIFAIKYLYFIYKYLPAIFSQRTYEMVPWGA